MVFWKCMKIFVMYRTSFAMTVMKVFFCRKSPKTSSAKVYIIYLKLFITLSVHSQKKLIGSCASCGMLLRGGGGDISSCGIFCALFGEFLLGERPSLMFDTSNITVHRQAIWRSMVDHAVDADNLCRTCGEQECPHNSGGNVDEWVSFYIRLTWWNIPNNH